MTATLTTLVTFNDPSNDANGRFPDGSLIADANGDLFGTTSEGGANGQGTVFEIAKTATGYASTQTVLVAFNVANGFRPEAGLIADATGDLFGTTIGGGPNDGGTVFEIVKTPTGYASTQTVLVSFNNPDGSTPGSGSLIADANGDLFGTTDVGGNGGTVFEIAKTPTGYASTPTTLVSFNGANGANPEANLIADANGDLFGTTFQGGGFEDGTVFEIAKTGAGYASTPTTLFVFDGAHGAGPFGGLIADANGDLFGTTADGGADNFNFGAVFEIAKTASGYASTPTILLTFNSFNGQTPGGSLIADANGDLFGTTSRGGSGGDGTVFEIQKTAAGYASTPIELASFNGTNGAVPEAGLIADANGDLFGTTDGGSPDGHDIGTVFEITNSGFVPVTPPPTGSNDILWQNTSSGQASIWDVNGDTRTGGGALSPNPGPSWRAVGTGDFNDDGHSDILWQNTDGQASIWEMDGTTRTGGGAVTPNPGPTWKAVGTGDFDGDGKSDILWQNTDGQAAIWLMNGNTRTGGGAAGANPGPTWKAVATGDFNKDGNSDILWQNTSTGQAAIWEMDGNTHIGGGPVTPNPGPTWKAVGTGDFNQDGFADILWQNTSTGQISIWEMNGNTRIGGGAVSAIPGPSWHAIGTGGGGSDILFQNTSGQVSIWDMDGTTRIGAGAVSANPGPNWRAVDLT
jgi:uncharacterized repeat protein (TIGR03803 family)